MIFLRVIVRALSFCTFLIASGFYHTFCDQEKQNALHNFLEQEGRRPEQAQAGSRKLEVRFCSRLYLIARACPFAVHGRKREGYGHCRDSHKDSNPCFGQCPASSSCVRVPGAHRPRPQLTSDMIKYLMYSLGNVVVVRLCLMNQLYQLYGPARSTEYVLPISRWTAFGSTWTGRKCM